MRDNRDRNSFQFKYLYLFDLLKSCISSVPYILTIATEYIHSAKSNYYFTVLPLSPTFALVAVACTKANLMKNKRVRTSTSLMIYVKKMQDCSG